MNKETRKVELKDIEKESLTKDLISEMKKIINTREVISVLDSNEYTVEHLNVILSAVLLLYFDDNIEKVIEFLDEYDDYILHMGELFLEE